MSNVIKAAKLDFWLVKPYYKNMCISLVVPAIIVFVNRSLPSAVSFAMCFISITAGYTFSISEKNGMERFYGALPVSPTHLVIGRYLYTCLMGAASLLFSIAVHPLILRALGENVQLSDIGLAVIVGIIVFSFGTVFSLPCYYKYGAIKGRAFMYIPVAGYLGILYLLSKTNIAGTPVLSALADNPTLAAAAMLLVCLMAYLFSILVSIHVLRNKEV